MMKTVKITAGTYGYHTSFGRLSPKDRQSEPFLLRGEEADRLVSLGVAEIVAEQAVSSAPGVENDAGESSAPTEALSAERPIYDGNTKASELREIGKNVGVKFSVGTTKEEMIAALDEYFDAYLSDSPSLSAEEPLV